MGGAGQKKKIPVAPSPGSSAVCITTMNQPACVWALPTLTGIACSSDPALLLEESEEGLWPSGAPAAAQHGQEEKIIFFQDNAAAGQANHPTRCLKLSYDKTPRSAIAHRSRYYCSKGPELSPSIFAPQPRSGYEPQGPQTSASEVSSCKECKQLRNASGFPTRIHRGKPRHQATAAFQERIRAEK